MSQNVKSRCNSAWQEILAFHVEEYACRYITWPRKNSLYSQLFICSTIGEMISPERYSKIYHLVHHFSSRRDVGKICVLIVSVIVSASAMIFMFALQSAYSLWQCPGSDIVSWFQWDHNRSLTEFCDFTLVGKSLMQNVLTETFYVWWSVTVNRRFRCSGLMTGLWNMSGLKQC